MARNASNDHQAPSGTRQADSRQDDAQHVQAAFDFMPQEMRQRVRFGDVLRAGRAEWRSQSSMIDRQVVGLGSRIAAARLREILRPASEMGMDAPRMTSSETQILDEQIMVPNTPPAGKSPSAQDLMQQRDILREIGTAVFYFRDEADMPQDAKALSQRLHPRPLSARYYGAPLQQAGAASGEFVSTRDMRKIA